MVSGRGSILAGGHVLEGDVDHVLLDRGRKRGSGLGLGATGLDHLIVALGGNAARLLG